MGKRLSKIYTKTGDQGTTGLGDGQRVAKNHIRVTVLGDVDELNSHIGLLAEMLEGNEFSETREFLRLCQHRVFDLGGEISIPGFELVKPEHVTQIELELDALNEHLPPLDNFILPGGSLAIAQSHVVRSVCRRAERAMVSLSEVENVNAAGQQLLNRLSDYFFVLCRAIARQQDVEEVLWRQEISNS